MSTSLKADGMKFTNAAGVTVFDTSPARRMINLVQERELTGTVALPFPSFTTMSAAYYYSRGSRNGNGGAPYAESCSTYGRIAAQNWGPGLPLNINRVLLGSVPAETTFIDVQVKLAQTVAPPLVLGTAILKTIVENEWISLSDNFVTLEDNGALKRGIFIEKIGNQVFASLYQSAAQQAVVHIQTKTDLSVSYLPADPPFPDSPNWHYGTGDSSPCSTSFSINLASTWSMTFKVAPGRHT